MSRATSPAGWPGRPPVFLNAPHDEVTSHVQRHQRESASSFLRLGTAAVALAAASFGVGCTQAQSSTTQPTAVLPNEGNLPSLEGATDWLNSAPLTGADLRGKVVLVQFWTFTCINWLRTLPYVRGWAEKYKDQGLVVIGVHTPEFSFEHNVDNVRRAAREMQLDYPIAIDSDYTIWNAFANHYWPALYFVDAQGNIRHHHFGEEAYEESERVIQQLLNEQAPATLVLNLSVPTPAVLKLLPIGTTWSRPRAISVSIAPRTSRPRVVCYAAAHASTLPLRG